MIENVRGIIWDWNGTLLNDAELAVETMNGMLAKRGLPLMTPERYKDVFTFPVKEYYQKIGFDFEAEPFEIPALEFIERYNQLVGECSLHNDSVRVLNHFREKGIPQFILSAMKQETLDNCLAHYEISHFFDHVSGLDDHYAHSKLENGLSLIRELKLNPEELLLIGDTIHDYEVATEMGCRCILIANGHQSHELLKSAGAPVLAELKQLLD
ncbi:MAG: HAD family hydrolase [Prolixibacteraceae bacterium]|nr:HAD family hydrolase [Prolixibacteraceae bacterium]